jgi:hypothetical protein
VPTSSNWRARSPEAEIDLRRIRRARSMLDKIPPPPAGYRSVDSANANLFMRMVSRASRQKNSSIERLTDMLLKAGWDPDAPDEVLAPIKGPDRRPAAIDRYERRALSRRKSAIRRFDLALRRDAPPGRELGGCRQE